MGKQKGKKAPIAPKPSSVSGFAPPGVSAGGGDMKSFKHQFDTHFLVPQRISTVPTSLIEAVNDFHYAMVNDKPRNDFYNEALKRTVSSQTGVLEIGAGSGLLSILAARCGAKWVVAVEGSKDMCLLARRNIAANGLEDRIKVIHCMSMDLQPSDLPEPPDIVVSEILGTLMLGESAHEYINDIRHRICKSTTRMIPQHGIQYAVPIESETIASITEATPYDGISLEPLNALRDTSSTVFTKKYGFRLNTVPFTCLAEPIPIVACDFNAGTLSVDTPSHSFKGIVAKRSGTATAMLYYWTVWYNELCMTTNPTETVTNFTRDMQWGQAIQLLQSLEDDSSRPLILAEGERYDVECRYSHDQVLVQCLVSPSQ